ncbi:Guanine nucleotide-binding protein subunit beta-like protein 1 [Nymphon striatum]|nr:Guanine nucleotide-binding protein subunit beta-like protein 1 [Nymphon striatum]
MSPTSPPQPIFSLRGHRSPVKALSFLDNHEDVAHCFVSGAEDGILKLWNINQAEVRIKGVITGTTAVCIVIHDTVTAHVNPISIHMVRACESMLHSYNTVCFRKFQYTPATLLWSDLSIMVRTTYLMTKLYEQRTSGLTICKKKLLVHPVEEKSSIQMFDLSSSKTSHKFQPTDPSKYGMVMCVKAMNGTSYIITGYEDGTIALWDIRQQQIISELKVYKEPVMCLDASITHSTCGIRLIAGSVNQEAVSLKLCAEKTLREERIELPSSGISCCQIRPDNKIVCLTSWDGTCRVYSWKKLKLLGLLDYHMDIIHCVKFSNFPIPQHGNLLAAASKDSQISLWSLY